MKSYFSGFYCWKQEKMPNIITENPDPVWEEVGNNKKKNPGDPVWGQFLNTSFFSNSKQDIKREANLLTPLFYTFFSDLGSWVKDNLPSDRTTLDYIKRTFC